MAVTMVTRACQFCHKSFEVRLALVKNGKGKFCSRSCKHQSQKKPKRRRPNDPQYAKDYHIKHKETINARSRAWHAAHRERAMVKHQEYRKTHKEELHKKNTERYQRNQEQIRERAKDWGRKNPERVSHRQKAWRLAHPEKLKAQIRRRQARERGAPRHDLTAEQWTIIVEQFKHRCAYCGKKSTRLTQDHILPVVKGGEHTLSNIVPACRSCNSKKGTGPPLTPVQPLLL